MLSPAPVYLDFRLDWLIEATAITQSRAERRLNGIENLIARLSSRWRADTGVDPLREIRVSSLTLRTMIEWVESAEKADGKTRTRLLAYSDDRVIDRSIPDGWLRVRLVAEKD